MADEHRRGQQMPVRVDRLILDEKSRSTIILAGFLCCYLLLLLPARPHASSIAVTETRTRVHQPCYMSLFFFFLLQLSKTHNMPWSPNGSIAVAEQQLRHFPHSFSKENALEGSFTLPKRCAGYWIRICCADAAMQFASAHPIRKNKTAQQRFFTR